MEGFFCFALFIPLTTTEQGEKLKCARSYKQLVCHVQTSRRYFRFYDGVAKIMFHVPKVREITLLFFVGKYLYFAQLLRPGVDKYYKGMTKINEHASGDL